MKKYNIRCPECNLLLKRLVVFEDIPNEPLICYGCDTEFNAIDNECIETVFCPSINTVDNEYEDRIKQLENLLCKVDEIDKFLSHNIALGYIKEDMTIKEFKDVFLINLSEKYIPTLKEIEELINIFENQ